jgi:hypothetical protein
VEVGWGAMAVGLRLGLGKRAMAGLVVRGLEAVVVLYLKAIAVVDREAMVGWGMMAAGVIV